MSAAAARPRQTVALLAVACGGCISQSGMSRARVLAPAENEISAGLEGTVIAARMTTEAAVPIPWVQAVGGYHRGLGSGVEAGARVWGLGVRGFGVVGGALDGKVQLRASASPRSGVDIALGTSLAYQHISLGGHPWQTGGVTVPLLFGANLGKHQLLFGPRAGLAFWAGESQQTLWLWLFGGAAGVSFDLGKSYRLTPELSALYTPISFNGTRDDPSRYGAWTLQLGLGLAKTL